MSNTYNEYATRFRENSAAKGLSFTLSYSLSAIPAALGHIADTILYLDGTILPDKKSHFSGPFGLLLGIVPFALGYIVGGILQFILNCPGYIGSYLVDHPLDFIFRLSLPTAMIQHPIPNMALAGVMAMTEKTPAEMQGPFGFIAGLLPHIARYIVHRIGGTFTSVIQYGADGVCGLIGSFYSYTARLVFTPSSSGDQGAASDNLGAEPRKKGRKIKRPDEIEENQHLNTAKKEQLDLFAILGFERKEYTRELAKKQFRKLSMVHHPDKAREQVSSNPAYVRAQKNYNYIGVANSVLTDEQLSAKYLKLYDANPQKYTINPLEAPSTGGAAPSRPDSADVSLGKAPFTQFSASAGAAMPEQPKPKKVIKRPGKAVIG